MDAGHHEIVVEAMRAIFLLGLPVVLALALVGTVSAALQTATALQDSALSYAVRVLTVIVVLYLMAPLAAQQLTKLAVMALG